MAPDYQRQSDRYELSACGEQFRCTIDDDTNGARDLAVVLNNISVGGVQVTLPHRVLNGAQFTLNMGPGDSRISVACVVRWTVPDHDGWVCGCQFEEQLQDSFLDNLARVGVLERRDNLRFDISLDGLLRVEGMSEQHSVRVVDYSNGGIGIQVETETPLDIGRKALLELQHDGETAIRFFTHIQWCALPDGRQRAGLRFMRDEDADTFLDCAESLSEV